MKRGVVGALIVVLIFCIVGFALAIYSNLIPENGHGGDETFIFVNGKNITLQDAIDGGEFEVEFVGTDNYSGSFDVGHVGERIIVNVNDTIKTLQESINDGSLCGTENGTNSSFGIIVNQDHTADTIWINVSGEEVTLQQAINNGSFYMCIPEQPFTGNVAESPMGGASYNTIFMDNSYFIGSDIIVINDGSSTGSFFGVNTYNTASTSGSIVDVIITFAEPVTTLTNISIVYAFEFVEPSIPGDSWVKLESTQIKSVGGAWITASGGGGNQEGDEGKWNKEVSGSWSDVEAIKIRFKTYTSGSGDFYGDGYFQSSWILYEITATGTQ